MQTWRPYTLWYIGLVGLAGAGLADGRHTWLRLAAAWAAPTVGWLGGHYLGDYFDRELDAASKPHRPIPSGRLRVQTALLCGCACLVALVALAVAGGWGTVIVAVLAGVGMVAYSRWFKARGIAGNLVRGALGALALLYGALVVGLRVPDDRAARLTLLALLALVVVFWAHDTMSNLVGTLRDVHGDEAGGYRTLPVRRGTAVAVRTVLALYGLTLAAAVAGGPLLPVGHRGAYFALLAAAVAFAAVALVPLPRYRHQMPVLVALRAHSVLVLERVVLATAVLGLGLGIGRALLFGVPALALTGWTQRLMRTSHELGPDRPPDTSHTVPIATQRIPAEETP